MRMIISALLILCCQWGYAAKAMTVNVDSSNPQFVVTLASNPTTGYQWTVTQYDKRLFKLLGSHFDAPRTRMLGAGGQMNFNFALIKGKKYPVSSQMVFTYARPWEHNNGTVQSVTLNFLKPGALLNPSKGQVTRLPK